MTALKPADDGNGLIVRLANHGSSAVPASVTTGAALPFVPAATIASDVLERPLATAEAIAPHGIATLRLRSQR